MSVLYRILKNNKLIVDNTVREINYFKKQYYKYFLLSFLYNSAALQFNFKKIVLFITSTVNINT